MGVDYIIFQCTQSSEIKHYSLLVEQKLFFRTDSLASCELLGGSSCNQSSGHHDYPTTGHTNGHHEYHSHHHEQSSYTAPGHSHDHSSYVSNGHGGHHPDHQAALDRSCSSLPSNSGDSSNLSAGEASNLSAGESSNISGQYSAGNDSGFISHNSTDQGWKYCNCQLANQSLRQS